MGEEEALASAAAELIRANEAAATARWALTVTIVAAYRAGIPLPRKASA